MAKSKNKQTRCYYSWLPLPDGKICSMFYYAINQREALAMHKAKGGNNSQCMVWERKPPIMLPAGSIVREKPRAIELDLF